jgi:hypothetical protein
MLNGARRGEHVEYTAIHTFKALLLVTHSCRHASSGSGLRKRRAHRAALASHSTFPLSPGARAELWLGLSEDYQKIKLII